MKYFIGSERKQVEKKLPFLMQWDEEKRRRKRKMMPFYDRYITAVSEAEHAASLEMATFLRFFCDNTEPRFILDLGSGLSSFVFAQYAAENKCLVVSVDDQEEWLNRTQEFVEDHEYGENHRFVMWDVFLKMTLFPYNLIFNDFGMMESGRIHALRRTFPIMMETGAKMILDDVHKPTYIKQVYNKVIRHPCAFYDLQDYTIDDLGRFAGLVVGEDD